jgi:hypothetical protein
VSKNQQLITAICGGIVVAALFSLFGNSLVLVFVGFFISSVGLFYVLHAREESKMTQLTPTLKEIYESREAAARLQERRIEELSFHVRNEALRERERRQIAGGVRVCFFDSEIEKYLEAKDHKLILKIMTKLEQQGYAIRQPRSAGRDSWSIV